MNLFTSVKVKKPRRSKFDLSHSRKLSARMGYLYPIVNQEVLPGDSFKMSSEVFIRFAPLIAPVMDRFYANVHYFFVPNRIIWDEWKEFITGGEDGLSTVIHPSMTMDASSKVSWQPRRVPDYFGIPPIVQADPVTADIPINPLPLRAYLEIYNEYYRDQNLEAEVDYSKTSGPQPASEYGKLTFLRTRSWKKDYFTSALPWAQRGAEVTLPFDDVNYKTQSEVYSGGSPATGAADAQSGVFRIAGSSARIENIESIGAPTINELRRAYRLQEWLENNARGGARYIEQILSHFGVRSSDARLQRPEYLGGGKTNVVISEVLNTTGLTDPTQIGGVQGRMAGHGISIGRTNYFKRSFEEHGWIIGILSVLPYASYFQGIHRSWFRTDKFDYAFPEFANIGEQPIMVGEIWSDQQEVAGAYKDTFGYTPRFAEYKYGFSSVHGDFRDNLDYWHYAQKYATKPALNDDFVRYANDNRIFNVVDQDIDNLYIHVYNNISAIRPLPYFGTPRT